MLALEECQEEKKKKSSTYHVWMFLRQNFCFVLHNAIIWTLENSTQMIGENTQDKEAVF